MYLRGFGVEKDVNLALRYLEKSMSSNANYATSKNYYDKATKENYGTKP
jgi:TPR repeat protein